MQHKFIVDLSFLYDAEDLYLVDQSLHSYFLFDLFHVFIDLMSPSLLEVIPFDSGLYR